ncbi:hypothetical protein GOP47_0008321 [Adiantum capillus-veneris]|uniref:Uncharacterized protein n=1 Tax=Adiantum capillus-veneris TaxID=13818 RepID=A0A9D4ZKB9_ADICA|nr:hypothetical protein GOP47_0008321 [Adiantum capillus-veneris]
MQTAAANSETAAATQTITGLEKDPSHGLENAPDVMTTVEIPASGLLLYLLLEVSSGLRAIDCQLLYDLAISIHGEDECAKAERLLLNIEGLCVKVHPLELTKLPIWSILAFTGKSSFSKILNNALRKKIHEFPCCRILMMQDHLVWGFFNNDRISNMFTAVRSWGSEVQNLLIETYLNSEVSVSMSDVQLQKTKDLDTKLSSVDAKVASLDTKVSSVDANVASLETKMSSVDAKVATLETTVKSLETVVSNLGTSVEHLSQQMGVLNIGIQDVLGRLGRP